MDKRGTSTAKLLQGCSHTLAPQGPVPLKLQLTLNGSEMATAAPTGTVRLFLSKVCAELNAGIRVMALVSSPYTASIEGDLTTPEGQLQPLLSVPRDCTKGTA